MDIIIEVLCLGYFFALKFLTVLYRVQIQSLILWFSLYSQSCTNITTINFGTFLSPPQTIILYPIAVNPLFRLNSQTLSHY